MGKRAGYDLTLSFDTFGAHLRYLRRRARLTQQQLGLAVGYSTPQISMLENGQRLPDLTALAALFIPALDLNDEPELARRLLQLASESRRTRERPCPPAAHPARRKSPAIQGDVLDGRAEPPTYRLPAPAVPLIGRESDLAAGLSRLLDPGVRLLTLIGPPGVGKTRLAMQMAWDARDLFKDGVAYVELAALTEPNLVIRAVSQTLLLESEAADLPAALGDKQLLLVLDNFEQVLPAASLIADLLARAPSLKVLVTSREALRIYGEHEYNVSPLLLPDLAHLPPVEDLANNPSVGLFVARAQAARTGFALTASNALAVAAVCIQLDGLPLALELAAAQVKLLSAQELATQLVGHMRLPMQQRARNLPGRHRSLRDAIDWSYLLLSPSEQRLFAQLGVFAGGFELAAAQAIHHFDHLEDSRLSLISSLQSLGTSALSTSALSTNALSINDVTSALLQSLIDKSLVQMVPATAPARFILLETLREYAVERLAAICDEAVYQRHAAYFLALAEEMKVAADDPHAHAGLERLARDYDNLRTAAHWLLDHDAIGALRLCILLAPFWQRYGYYSEARRLFLQALTRASDHASMELRAQGYMEASALAQRQEDAPESLRLSEISLSIYRTLGDTRGMAQALRQRGWASFQAHDRPAAAQHFQASLALYRELGDKPHIADALTSLAHVTHQPGVNDRQVNELLQESLAIQRELGLSLAEAHTLAELGYLESCMGHPESAEARYSDSLAIFRTAGSRHDIAWTQCALGEAAWHQEQLDKAERYYKECKRAFEELGTPSGVTIVLHHLAQVQRRRGRLDEAERLYAESLRQSTEQANEHMIARCLAGLGGVALARGRVEPARQFMRQAFALFARLPPFLAPADRSEYEAWMAGL